MSKLYWLRTLLMGFAVMCLVSGGVVLAQDETTPITPPVQVTGAFAAERLDFDSRSMMIPEELSDPAFDRYVDITLLGKAWDDMDPVLLTDMALQLAEGERILMRSHKSISADKVMEVAIRLASEGKNKATLDRLAKVIAKRDNAALKTQLATAISLSGESRAVNPAMMVKITSMTPDAFAVYRNILLEIEKMRVTGNTDGLKPLEEAIKELDVLQDKQRDNLLKLIAETRSAMPKDAKPDPTIEVLDKLADTSRSWGGWVSRMNKDIKHGIQKNKMRQNSRPSGGARTGTLAIGRESGGTFHPARPSMPIRLSPSPYRPSRPYRPGTLMIGQ